MSILGAQPLSPVSLAIFLPLIILPLLLLAWRRAGVFRRGSIVGPPRVAPGESLFTPMAILFIAYLAGILAMLALRMVLKLPPDLAALLSAPAPSAGATTLPTTRPLSPESVRLLYVLNLAFSGVVFLTLLLLSIALRAGALRHLGLLARQVPRGILAGFLTAMLVVPVVYAAGAVMQAVIHLLDLTPPAPHPVLEQLAQTREPAAVAILVVLAVIMAPLTEELTFRGYLQTLIAHVLAWLRRRKPASEGLSPLPAADAAAPSPSAGARWIAVLLASLLFAAVHAEIAFIPPLFALSVGIGYVYERTGNLWACIFTHAIFNGFQIATYLTVFRQMNP